MSNSNQTNTQRKIGFWSVLALVIATQIGSGIFVLPATLAPFGWYTLLGWVITVIGAISIAIVFAKLCELYPETGGPHIYVLHVFGKTPSFFIGWTYWILSWFGNTAVITSCIGYLSPLLGIGDNKLTIFILEIILLIVICILNLKGIVAASITEFILTIVRFIPLVIIPIFSIFHINKANFAPTSIVYDMSLMTILSKIIVLSFWGFVGIELATTPAGSVENPIKTIPKAIIIGTCIAGIIYILNSTSILGIVGSETLSHSKAPYVDATNILFSANLAKAMSIIAAIICISNLNAWTLASGQILLGLAEKGLAPEIFMKKNKYDVPIWAILASIIGIIPLLLLTVNESYAKKLTIIINISVVAFLFIYLICAIALLKILITQKKLDYFILICILIAVCMCSFIISTTTYKTLLITLAFLLSTIPIYVVMRNKIKNNNI